MLTKVKEWIECHRLIRKGDKVVVACSGGPDSLALVHILCQLAEPLAFDIAVAHLDHMFRGAQSAADADFVRDFCARLGLPCYVKAMDVPEYIRQTGLSTQEAARIVRYHYLQEVASEFGGAKIATGHHKDDQAETILLHLFRGAGSSGMEGMKPENGNIIHPLLAVSRKEIENYCREQGFTPRLDASNLKTDYLRNYLRLDLIPQIEREINSSVKDALIRAAQIIGDEHSLVEQQAQALWREVVSEQQGRLILSRPILSTQHVALQRQLIRLAIEKKRGDLRGISFCHVEKVIELVNCGITGSEIKLPSLIVAKSYSGLEFFEPGQDEPPAGISSPVMLSTPGITEVPELNLAVAAEISDYRPPDKGRLSAIFDWDILHPPISVRTRQAGDKFHPAGAPGGKKLKEYLIDAKVPRRERDAVPVICDDKGIIWLAGLRISEHGRPGDGTKRFLQLIIERQEE